MRFLFHFVLSIGYQFIIFILQGGFLLYLHEFDQELYLIKHLQPINYHVTWQKRVRPVQKSMRIITKRTR